MAKPRRDGAGYTYTIGTGGRGRRVAAGLHGAWLLGRDAGIMDEFGRDCSSTLRATVSLAVAAVDNALWARQPSP